MIGETGRTLALAVAALLLFVALFGAGRLSPGPAAAPRPASAGTTASGYSALAAALRAGGMQVSAAQVPLDRLSRAPQVLPPRGNLLVLTLPAVRPYRSEEWAWLDRWLRDGNALLVVAALDDAPAWAASAATAAAHGSLLFDLATLTGLEFEAAPAAAAAGRVGHTLRLQNPGDPLAVRIDDLLGPAPAPVWLRTLGDGRVVVLAVAGALSNGGLKQSATPLWAARLVTLLQRAPGHVVFDDFHQGQGGAAAVQGLLQDPRWRGTFGVLLAAWLIWVFGARPPVAALGNRSGDANGEPAPDRQAARYLRRMVAAPEAAQRLLQLFDRRLGPRIVALDGDARMPRAALESLAAQRAAAAAGAAPDLGELQRVLSSIERRIG